MDLSGVLSSDVCPSLNSYRVLIMVLKVEVCYYYLVVNQLLILYLAPLCIYRVFRCL